MDSAARVTTDKGPGSPGRGSELKLRVHATGHGVCAGAPPWASGEPGGQQPPVCVRVGEAATPPPPGHLGLPGQSERSTTLSQGGHVPGPGEEALTWGLFLSALRASHLGGLPLGVGRGPAYGCGQISAAQFGLLDQAVPEEDASTQTNTLSPRVRQLGLDADTSAKRPHSLLGAAARLTKRAPGSSGPPQLTGFLPRESLHA